MSPTTATSTYRLGDEIPLEDLLALPPDGQRYGRDERGRLCLMSPERFYVHRAPITMLHQRLAVALPPTRPVTCEGSLALPVLVRLDGSPLPESPLGPRGLEPDLVVFDGWPRSAGPTADAKSVHVDKVTLVVEVLSARTWRSDLGVPRPSSATAQKAVDDVDRWQSYLRSGVPEVWMINVGVPGTPLPIGSGLFVRNAGATWAPAEVEGSVSAVAEPIHGIQPVVAGRIRSRTGFVLDLAEFLAAARAAREASEGP